MELFIYIITVCTRACAKGLINHFVSLCLSVCQSLTFGSYGDQTLLGAIFTQSNKSVNLKIDLCLIDGKELIVDCKFP